MQPLSVAALIASLISGMNIAAVFNQAIKEVENARFLQRNVVRSSNWPSWSWANFDVGPAQMSEKNVRDLFDNGTVREIVQTLCGVCEKDPSFKAFNHQNAWSRKDLIALLQSHGFQVQTCPKDELVSKYSNLVPDIEFMGNWSMYVEAKKIEEKPIN